MKYSLLIVLTGFLLTGCAQEAIYLDQEFGVANRDAFARQIVYKDYRYADKKVEGLDGIHAENVMDTYHKTYTEGFTKEDVDIMETGLSD